MRLQLTTQLTICRWNDGPSKTSVGRYFKSFSAFLISTISVTIDGPAARSVSRPTVHRWTPFLHSWWFLHVGLLELLSVTTNNLPTRSVDQSTDRRNLCSPTLCKNPPILFQVLEIPVDNQNLRTITRSMNYR